jgi:hypothetical protein
MLKKLNKQKKQLIFVNCLDQKRKPQDTQNPNHKHLNLAQNKKTRQHLYELPGFFL